MAINKLWVIISGIILLLLVSILALSRHPTSTNAAEADAAHNSFMVEGGSNDHETGVTPTLGSGQPLQHHKPQSNDHETGAISTFGSGQSKHH